jgi:hypothetical protein
LALIFYVLAAVLALRVHIPQDVQRATLPALTQLLDADDSDAEAIPAVADLHLTTLRSVRSLNGTRAWFLLLAIASEIVAIAATGVTAWRVIG